MNTTLSMVIGLCMMVLFSLYIVFIIFFKMVKVVGNANKKVIKRAWFLDKEENDKVFPIELDENTLPGDKAVVLSRPFRYAYHGGKVIVRAEGKELSIVIDRNKKLYQVNMGVGI